MDFSKIDRLHNSSFNNREKFLKVARYSVEAHTIDKDENFKNDLSWDLAYGMALGAALKKNDHVLTGVTIGVLGTALTVGLYNKFKKRRNTDKRMTKEELDEIGIKTFDI